MLRGHYGCEESVNCEAGEKILRTEGSCNFCGAKVAYTKFWSPSQRLADGKLLSDRQPASGFTGEAKCAIWKGGVG